MGPWVRVHPSRPSTCSPDFQASVQHLVPAFAACASKALYAVITPDVWLVYGARIPGMGSRPHSAGEARWSRRAHSFSTGLRMCSIVPWYRAEYSRLLSEWVLEGRHSYNGGASERPLISQHCGCCHHWCPIHTAQTAMVPTAQLNAYQRPGYKT